MIMQATPTNLASAVPHVDGVVVAGVHSATGGVYPAQLPLVVHHEGSAVVTSAVLGGRRLTERGHLVEGACMCVGGGCVWGGGCVYNV